jgi:hypothetical protein
MEATPPDEPIKPKPPTPRRAKAPKAAQPVAAPAEPVAVAEIEEEVDVEQEATRVLGAFALGLIVLLLFCVIALLVAYRNIPEGL